MEAPLLISLESHVLDSRLLMAQRIRNENHATRLHSLRWQDVTLRMASKVLNRSDTSNAFYGVRVSLVGPNASKGVKTESVCLHLLTSPLCS